MLLFPRAIVAGCLTLLLSLPSVAQLSNRPAPPFRLPDTQGNIHELNQYRGKLVLLEFVNTAAPEFEAFAKRLAAVQHKYGERLAVLAVAVYPDTMQTAAAFVEKHQPPFTVLFDGASSAVVPYLSSGQAAPRIAVPHLFVIDPSGYIRDDFDDARLKTKFAKEDSLTRFVEAYLN